MGKNLVLYFSKNNTTKETVDKIVKKAGSSVDTVDLKKAGAVDFSKYDKVFIGCGIYAGKVDGTVKKFIAKNKSGLAGKNVVFFIHGIISQDTYKQAVSTAIAGNLDMNKVKVMYLGGKLDITTQNFLVKKMLIAIAKQNNFDPYNANTLSDAKVNELLAMF